MGARKICQLILGVPFLESRAILVLLLKMYYFYTYISGSQGKWKTSASLWTKKRKKVIRHVHKYQAVLWTLEKLRATFIVTK